MRLSLRQFAMTLCTCFAAIGCGGKGAAAGPSARTPEVFGGVLRVAVTTSTRDSGLLDDLLPEFERAHSVRVDVIAVGTGAALKQGRDGNVDAVIVHSRADEDAFMEGGHGVRREDLMSNTFLILGPPGDPAGISTMTPEAGLRRIAEAGERFVSRGDRSGTHMRELQLWNSTGSLPQWDGYVETGQGQSATLTVCNQMQGYMLIDRGTYLAHARALNLVPCSRPSASLLNAYGVLAVDPGKHPSIRGELANRFVDYLISPEAQRIIAGYEVAGELLFQPAHPTD